MSLEISGTTRVCGIIGNPISHTASPRMHAAAYKMFGMDWTYVAFPAPPDRLDAAVKAIRGLGLVGVNVTIPYKESVIPYLDELSPQARLVGAVNTIVNQNGRLIGHTTDGDGFLLALQNEYQAAPAGKRICLIGAGGSARSIAFSLAHHGAAEIVIANRTRYRAEILAHDVQEAYPSALLRAADFHIAAMPHLLSEMDWIINTTPIGMAPSVGDTPINDMSWVSDAHLVCDIIYTPNPTRFLREAGERGAVISSGAGMLAGQGVLAFQLFSGREVPFKVMRNEV